MLIPAAVTSRKRQGVVMMPSLKAEASMHIPNPPDIPPPRPPSDLRTFEVEPADLLANRPMDDPLETLGTELVQ